MESEAERPPESVAEENHAESEEDALLAKVQRLIQKTVSTHDNPNPRILHALASILEAQEANYLRGCDISSLSNGRASHTIGKLGNLIREHDDFFELISCKFLSESRYSTTVRAAVTRLLLSCSPTWTYPHVFDDEVLENIKHWVWADILSSSENMINRKLETDVKQPSDVEMLSTYATGLLSLALGGGGQVVEDVLTSGLPAKLIRYLRSCILGDVTVNLGEVGSVLEARYAQPRSREENKVRNRQNAESTHAGNLSAGSDISGGEQGDVHDCVNYNISVNYDTSSSVDGIHGVTKSTKEETGDDMWRHEDEVHGNKGKPKSDWLEDSEENAKDAQWRQRGLKGVGRIRMKGRNAEGSLDNDLSSLGSVSCMVDTVQFFDLGKRASQISDNGQIPDAMKYLSEEDGFGEERVEKVECADLCKVGTRDISDIVRKAAKAAEAEAEAAHAPREAVIAAGDAAADFVKSSALEALRSTNDEEAAVLAASDAATTVTKAATASKVVRGPIEPTLVPVASAEVEQEMGEDLEDFSVPNQRHLGQLRERYCIRCLEILGEYVEVLGPVLQEKGVDICLAMLQFYTKHEEASECSSILADILKLICSLAAHRKFAAVFVDKGGMQKLLGVPRASQTYIGLSSCLFSIGTLQGIMERVCALPSDVIYQVIELTLQLLECPQDQARKNAAAFLASAFVFRAVLDSFDVHEGLQKMLNLLHTAASVRAGNNSVLGNQPNTGIFRNDRSSAEVLTASEKQIAYQTSVALRQYFRAHLLLLVDSLRPNKNQRSIGRNVPTAKAAYKPLDISNEAMDAIFSLIQRDRKIGPAFVRARWSTVDKFLSFNGHIIMLELCQAPTVERYLHDLAQYALGVLHIVTLVPYSRKLILNATLSNDRVGMAVILDAANGAGFVDPEVIQPALNVLVNLVCPPPSISNKPPIITQNQQCGLPSAFTTSSITDRANFLSNLGDHSNGPAAASAVPSGVVGDRRISLGQGAGCAGLAAQLEQGYSQAREAVRANNGIKVLLHLLHPRIFTPPATLDCLRALACRILLGLARDNTIAHILTKLQVGKKLSELIRDSGSQASVTEQGRWQTELTHVAIELIATVTNCGRATTLAASDATAPTLRRIERAAIAAATPITYHSRELLLLMHEHLQASGLTATAAALLKEADLTPLTYFHDASSHLHQTSVQDVPPVQIHWPSGRASGGFLPGMPKMVAHDATAKCDSHLPCSKKKSVLFSNLSSTKCQVQSHLSFTNKKYSSSSRIGPENTGLNDDALPMCKSPILLPMKRKIIEAKDNGFLTPAKRMNLDSGFQTPVRQLQVQDDSQECSTSLVPMRHPAQATLASDPQSSGFERVTLDSLVVQYLKHQHRQCPAPITTLPPLSLLHPHMCPEPSRNQAVPKNITARLGTRACRHGGINGLRKDRQFVYSRFRPWRTCRDNAALLTCITFLDTSRVVTGCHSGEIKMFDASSGNILESHACHQSSVILVQSALLNSAHLILSSGTQDARLWDASSLSTGPIHSFEGCKFARFSHSGTHFAALSTDSFHREVLLYDVETGNLDFKFSDSSSQAAGAGRGHMSSLVHFSPLDTMLLWNGVLWDKRDPCPIHRFDQFTDYGGGGFHPAGNEVIINSEVWDLRRFKLLRSVPSLDQTVITFNPAGDVIYAILRRNLEDITSAVHTRRVRHPLFPALLTVDAVNYSDIAVTTVDRCILDFAADPTDSVVGVVAMDDHEEMFSSARLYEIGRKRPTEDDSDPDDGAETDEDEEDDEEEEEAVVNLDLVDSGADDSEQDESSNEDGEGDDAESDDDYDDDDDDEDELRRDLHGRFLQIVAEAGDEDDYEYGQADPLFDSDDEE